MTTVSEQLQNAASKSGKKGNKVKTAPKTTGTVNAIVAEMTIKEVVTKYPVLAKMFNNIEIQEFQSRGDNGFMVGQVTFIKNDTKGAVSRRNWVKIGSSEDSPIFAMKKTWKDDKGVWQRAKRATVNGHKFDDDETYSVSRAIERAALNVMMRHMYGTR
jgi:hypothetical protein